MTFTEEFKIPYYDSNIKGYATPESLLTYMGEVATRHSDDVGLDIENLRKNNYGWMLNRWKVKINEYPLAMDSIEIKTWASDFRKFYADREFKILSKDHKELVEASSVWIFLDMKRKRPIRVTEDVTNRYGIEGNQIFEGFYDFEKPFATENGLTFRVRKSDIDYNHHVNNVKYFQWMLEALPRYIDEEYILEEFEIQYRKEVGLGSLIDATYEEDKNDDPLTILHQIQEQGEIRAFGRTKWRKTMT